MTTTSSASRVKKISKEQGLLRSERKPGFHLGAGSPIRIVDLFSGCGGMTLGAALAARKRRRPIEVCLAMDSDADAVRVYESNFSRICGWIEPGNVEGLFDGSGKRMTAREQETRQRVGPSIDLLMGGPPCQGNSDLNNHTRRSDPRNSLYSRMARAARVLDPRVVVIENVPAVRHDRNGVVDETTGLLEKLGYTVSKNILLRFDCLGVPQARKRHFLIASRGDELGISQLSESLLNRQRSGRTVQWAIEDLLGKAEGAGSGGFDAPPAPSAENRKRIDWLFDEDEHDLADSQRPRCHRSGGHSYRSIYGRLHWQNPAQTITTGFGSMGQGRYVHPCERRTITPHEAARLQSFPDFFRFTATEKRTTWAKVIGNAVPPLAMREIAGSILDRLPVPE